MLNIPSIESILEKHGPLPASDIQKYLTIAGLSGAAARQRISRSRQKVKRLYGLPLPKNESFLHLEEQYANSDFWIALLKAHISRRSSYGIALLSIIARDGVIPLSHIKTVTGAPDRMKKHISCSTVIQRLIKAEFLRKGYDLDFGDYVAIHARDNLMNFDLRAMRSRLQVEAITINAVREWARKLGLVSYNAVKIRDNHNMPVYGQFGWDITGPSYILPLASYYRTKAIPGFFVADIVYTELNHENVLYFINKCLMTRCVKTMKPFLAMLIAERFTKEAFQLGKQNGVIFTTPKDLFGDEVAAELSSLAATLKNAAATAVKNPESVNKLLSSLSRIEGAALNLRGALFELVVGHLVFKGEGNLIDIGLTVHNDKGITAEIDVRRIKGDHEIAIYECKGKQPTGIVTYAEVDKWLSQKIPIINESLQSEERFKKYSVTHEFWTSGNFEPKAKMRLQEAKKITKKYAIDWKNGQDILSYARDKKLTSMVDFITQHYARHPLSDK